MAWLDLDDPSPFSSPLEEQRYLAEFDAQHRRATLNALSKLKQTTSMIDYQETFEELTMIPTGISEPLLISYYITGLRPDIRRELFLAWPSTLMNAFAQACACEARIEARISDSPFISPVLPTPVAAVAPTPPTLSGNTSPPNPCSPSIPLTTLAKTTLLAFPIPQPNEPSIAIHTIVIDEPLKPQPSLTTTLTQSSHLMKPKPMFSTPPSKTPSQIHTYRPLSLYPLSVQYSLSSNPFPFSNPIPDPPLPDPPPEEQETNMVSQHHGQISKNLATNLQPLKPPPPPLSARGTMLDPHVVLHMLDFSPAIGSLNGVKMELDAKFPFNMLLIGGVRAKKDEHAEKVFDKMPYKSFQRRVFGVMQNSITMLRISHICIGNGSIELCKSVHAYMVKVALSPPVSVGHAFLKTFWNLGNLENHVVEICMTIDVVVVVGCFLMKEGMEMKDVMPKNVPIYKAQSSVLECDVVTNDILLSAWVRVKKNEDAWKVFDEWPHKSTVTFSIMAYGFEIPGFYKEILQLFLDMQGSCIYPNSCTFITMLIRVMTICVGDEGGSYHKVMNHGVSNEVIEEIKVGVEEFLKLKNETFAPLSGGVQRYSKQIVLNGGRLEWLDMMFLITQPLHARNFTFWLISPIFMSTLDKYSTVLQLVSKCLFDTIAKNLGLNQDVRGGIFKDHQRMRLNHYPPCTKANPLLGINPRTDAGGLTLLLQVRDGQGLQIQRRGKWLQMEPLEDALDFNSDDALEVLINGEYTNGEHIVERLSIDAYHSPSWYKLVNSTGLHAIANTKELVPSNTVKKAREDSWLYKLYEFLETVGHRWSTTTENAAMANLEEFSKLYSAFNLEDKVGFSEVGN